MMNSSFLVKGTAVLTLLLISGMILGWGYRGGDPPVTNPVQEEEKSEMSENTIPKSDQEWRQKLSDEEFRILREKGTERAFTGEFWNHKEKGSYLCAGCGNSLFSSDTKYESGSGWPSFWKPVDKNKVSTETDHSHGMVRTEVTCSRCGGHLGHVFPDGPQPTGQRYCINSASLDFDPEDK